MARFTSLLSKVAGLVTIAPQPRSLPELIDQESIIGGELFGKIDRGVSRRFFLDEGDSWFFAESARDTTTGRQLYSFTIRYQFVPQGILKSVDGRGHVLLKGEELKHLLHAIKLYEKRVAVEVYGHTQPATSLV